jgi:hypothetical protein
MSLIWTPRKELVMRKELYRPVDFRALLAEHGLPLSLPAVIALFSKTPRAFRVRTLQGICNALNCRLSDFCDIEPDPPAQSDTTSNQLLDSLDEGIFPDPYKFEIHIED